MIEDKKGKHSTSQIAGGSLKNLVRKHCVLM